MPKLKWDEFEYEIKESNAEFEVKKSSKLRKRKWREIETLKEQQRLKKELMTYDEYSF